ncbi:MAG: flagellar basal body-associated protein FliL [Enterobacter hormaechei]|nr:flagellar basal body-associated protein FliL [Enterobacter hormaechei]
MTDSAITKKSKRSIWIPLLVLITLAACATAGYSYWRMQQDLKDEATRARLNDYLPEVRSRLLLLFSRQDASALATDVGKQKLVDAIKQTLATPLVNGQPKQEVTDVLYTAFILR